MTTALDTLALAVASEAPKRRRKFGPLLVSGIAFMIALILVAIFAPMFLRDSAETLTDATRLGPSANHLLGTDAFGRDMLARTLTATRLTLVLTFAASLLSVIAGIAIGTLVWMLPVRLRRAILGVNAIAVAFPTMVLALIIAAVLGAGAWQAVIAIAIANVPSFVRLTANMAGPIMHRDFVMTSKLLRVPQPLLVTRHVLPNMAEPLLILAASNFVITLGELSALSFLGLGVQSPEYDFGSMLRSGLTSIFSSPWLIVGPCVMIILVSLSAMLIGDGLAARANPRTQSIHRNRTGVLTAAEKMQKLSVTRHVTDESNVVVRVKDLRVKSASGLELVKGVSFEVRQGEILGLVGESGSGKSLTAMSIADLVPEGVVAEADEILIGGNDMLRGASASQLARDIALVYQDPMSSFNPALKVGKQLTESARTHFGMNQTTARTALVEQFKRLRISEPENRFDQHPYELSGGMLQRAMIASALLSEPKLIIADEPTTALDVTVQAEVLKQFVAVTDSLGAAMLFISHDLGVVEALCDRVCVMYKGEIVEELTSEQLRDRDVQHPYTKKLLDAAAFVEVIK